MFSPSLYKPNSQKCLLRYSEFLWCCAAGLETLKKLPEDLQWQLALGPLLEW